MEVSHSNSIKGRSHNGRSAFFSLSFWALSIYLFAKVFQLGESLDKIDWYFSILFHISIVLTVYLNLRWLIPRHLQKRQFLAYAFTFIAVLGFGTFLNQLTFAYLADWIFPGYYFIAYLEFWEIALYIGFYLIITGLIKLSNDWFIAENERQRAEKREKERLDEELRALKGQINPHFLFNNLNLLYSLSMRKADELPELIVQLSDLLRYVLYQSNTDKVKLAQEVKLVSDYIALSRKRMSEKADVKWQIDIEDEERMLPPLLFLPIVENGFKHGIFNRRDEAQLTLTLTQRGNSLKFVAENPIAESREGKQEEGGVGLDNLHRRLERLFPGGHQLRIREEKGYFRLELQIDLDQCAV